MERKRFCVAHLVDFVRFETTKKILHIPMARYVWKGGAPLTNKWYEKGFALQCLSMVNEQQQYEWVSTVKKSLEESVEELQRQESGTFRLQDLVYTPPPPSKNEWLRTIGLPPWAITKNG